MINSCIGYENIKRITIEPKKKYVYVTVKQGKITYTYKHRKDLFSFDMNFHQAVNISDLGNGIIK